MFSRRSALLMMVILSALSPNLAFAQSRNAKIADVTDYNIKAEALLQEAAYRLHSAQFFSGTVTTTNQRPATKESPATAVRYVRTFRLQKPARVHQVAVTQRKSEDGQWQTASSMDFNSNGANGQAMIGPTKRGSESLPASSTQAQAAYLDFPEFFYPNDSDVQQVRDAKVSGRLVWLKTEPDAVWAGEPCTVIEKKVRIKKDSSGTNAFQIVKIYVGQKDGLIRGYHSEITSSTGDGSVQISDLVLSNIALNAAPPATSAEVPKVVARN